MYGVKIFDFFRKCPVYLNTKDLSMYKLQRIKTFYKLYLISFSMHRISYFCIDRLKIVNSINVETSLDVIILADQ